MADAIEDLRQIEAFLYALKQPYKAGQIADAIAEIERLRAASVGADVGAGWQPIETAPKDGTDVILLTKQGQFAAYWLIKTAREEWNGWHVYDGHEGHLLQTSPPTHWHAILPTDNVGAAVGAEADLPKETA